MGRPSKRAERRVQILEAFARVLADHGYAGATIAAVASAAEVAPGLVHHHFESKEDLLSSLLQRLVDDFRRRTRGFEDETANPAGVFAYVNAALVLDERADVIAAKCWVGVLAEALRNPTLFARVRRMLDTEVDVIAERSRGALGSREASAVLAFVLGALVLGAFAPRKTAGFAAPAARVLIDALAR
ncbi:MAG: TetR/AcrR family transcriptional regulator [Polyangiaceae bacterium]